MSSPRSNLESEKCLSPALLKIHDMHATMLHLLGMDHTRLTFRYSGRDIRLMDVHGEVIHDILS